MKKVIAVMGKTASGKDTVTNYLHDRYGIDAVCSYGTRPMRSGETQGKEHLFIDKETMQNLLHDEHILAYTRFPVTGYEYCTTLKQPYKRRLI